MHFCVCHSSVVVIYNQLFGEIKMATKEKEVISDFPNNDVMHLLRAHEVIALGEKPYSFSPKDLVSGRPAIQMSKTQCIWDTAIADKFQDELVKQTMKMDDGLELPDNIPTLPDLLESLPNYVPPVSDDGKSSKRTST